ncbi:MAG: hypothetical protein IPK80_30085 [Nannocystis sp.]|nr:hypothetical protein [Nannocystis sp.]
MSNLGRLHLVLALLVAVACSGDSGGTTATLSGGATTTATATTATTSASGTTATSAESESSTSVASTGATASTTVDDTGGLKLDVGALKDLGGGGTDEGCKKIDFLFVIDNSNSMANEQQLLVDAFPDFIAAIEDGLPVATDYHIGVTKTDIFGFDEDPTPDPQNPCPYVLGGLLATATPAAAKTGTGASCNFASGEQYMTGGPALAAEFACAAAVGTKGNTGEYQAGATLAALSDALAQPGACNEGFLRDDALLIVTLITDEDDDWSDPDNAQAWFDGVVAAKDGVETNIVFLLISGGEPKWPGCGPLDFNTNTGADASTKLTEWATKFTNHQLGSVCEAGYAGDLSAALAIIATACEEFTPPS